MQLLAVMAVLLVGGPLTPGEETAIRTAVLVAYFNELHGGTGIAFPDNRRPVVVSKKTTAPRAKSLTVRVSSPANSDAAARFEVLKRTRIVDDLLERSRRPVRMARIPLQYVSGSTAQNECGVQFDEKKYADAVAVSRPGFSKDRSEALIYLEGVGFARAYYLRQAKTGWVVEWHVELWACG